MPPIKFKLNPTYHSGGDVKNVKANGGLWADNKQQVMA